MPLPVNGTPWPPKPYIGPLEDMRRHSAWYAGDRTSLAAAYGRENIAAIAPAERSPAERLKFWGRRGAPNLGARDNRLHIPLAADIATTSADLLFSEPPTFVLPDGTGSVAAQDRLDQIVDEGGIVNRLLEAAEVAAALGGVYLKADWDTDLAKHPLLGVVHADAALPEFSWGILRAVTFWRELDNVGVTVRRLLERHEPGQIEFGLYEGTKDNLGMVVPLTEHPDLTMLAEGLTAGNVKRTGVTGLTAAYIPNMRPNRRYRGLDWGRSDYQGVEDLFDALDETWTSWMRDIRLGRGRLVVPQAYLQNLGRGSGAAFDPEQEVYAGLEMPPTATSGAASITMTQFAIRVDEHSRSAQALMEQAIGTAGYAPQTFGLDTGPKMATATEVVARQKRSYTTRNKKGRYWAPELSRLLEVMLQLDVALGFSRVMPDRPQVIFPDAITEDPQSTAQTLALLEQARALSTDTKVRRLNPEWDDQQVAEEVARIHSESGASVPSPFAGPSPFGPMPGGSTVPGDTLPPPPAA